LYEEKDSTHHVYCLFFGSVQLSEKLPVSIKKSTWRHELYKTVVKSVSYTRTSEDNIEIKVEYR